MPYLAYEEPSITVILSLTSFILFLNGVRWALDRLLYCGIIGEILIGIIWGLPVGGISWLSLSLQESIQALGYLGLIGLVFQGGMETDIVLLKKNALISVAIATVGLLMPIALSFLLILLPFSTAEGTAYPTPLAAFSAGASLCSTSLGTTFAILSSANLQKTRVGIVLVGAAMTDDVVGLVMVNIVTTLGNGGSSGWSIARPIVASFGLLLVVLAITPFVLKPLWVLLCRFLKVDSSNDTQAITSKRLQARIALLVQTSPNIGFSIRILILVVFVTIASFINASVLFAAFIAGGLVHYLADPIKTEDAATTTENDFNDFLQPVLDYLLLPFFFASIGFSIPLTDMFTASIVWKGITYTALMIIGKGLVVTIIYAEHLLRNLQTRKSTHVHLNIRTQTSVAHIETEEPIAIEKLKTPHSVALLVGFAMVARGEIGFLIASLSQSSGTLTLKARSQTSSESSGEAIFLVIIWSVVVCTIIGPVAVGIIVRRLKRTEHNPLLTW